MKVKIMVIMTITLILISGWYLTIFIKADNNDTVEKDLVIKQGTDISEIIKYPNYLVITNTVDINKPGSYHIIYRHVSDNHEVTKNVYVIGEEQCNFFMKSDIIENASSGKNEIWDTIYNNGINAIINYKIEGYYGNNVFYLKQRNNKFYTLNIARGTGILLNDMEQYNDVVVMTGYEKNSINGDYNIVIYKEHADKISRVEITSPGFDEGQQISLNELYYFVGGKTDLTNNTFTGKRLGEDSYIMVIDRLTNDIENVTMLSLEGDDTINDIKCIDNYLYVLQNCNNASLRILKMDVFGNIIAEKTIPLSYGVKNAEFHINNDQLFLKYSYYKYEHLDYVDTIKVIDRELNIEDYFEYFDPLLELKYFETTEEFLKLVYINKRGESGFTYRLIKDNVIIGSYFYNSGGNPCGLEHDQIIDLSTNGKIIRNFMINSLYIEQEMQSTFTPRMTYNEINYRLSDYSYYINGIKIHHHPSSNLTFDINIFGEYDILYYFNEVFDFYLTKRIDVLPYGMVENGKTYDVGVEVSGNGQVFLNNELIETPYKINKPGSYQLKIIGKNQTETFINFKVDYLSQEISSEICELDEIDIYSESINKELNLSIPLTKNEEKNTNKATPNILYLIPLLTGAIGFIIIRKGN